MAAKRIKYFGPPGTGKTTKIVSMAPDYLEYGTVCICSHTKAAEAELMDRLGGCSKKLQVRTINALVFNALGKTPGSVVGSPRDLLRKLSPFIDEELEELGRKMSVKDFHERAHSIYSAERNRLERYEPDEYPWDFTRRMIDDFELEYKLVKEREAYLDQTDILEIYLEQGKPLEFDTLIVDEAQDCTVLQWKVVEKMATNAKYLIVVGDDDQCLYDFAGAKGHSLVAFECDEEHVLDHSWRLPAAVYTVARKISSQITDRKDKDFTCATHEGHVLLAPQSRIMELAEEYDNTVIMGRTYFATRELRSGLLDEMYIFGGPWSCFRDAEVIDLIRTWKKWQRGDEMLHRPIQQLFRSRHIWKGLSKPYKPYKKLDSPAVDCPFEGMHWSEAIHCRDSTRLQELEESYGQDILMEDPKVEITNIHRAKGREWDQVILLPDVTGRVWEDMHSGGINDEHRAWYVAVTRAKRRLVLIDPQTPRYYNLNL